ncbi:hypothetical protein tb265_32560 [Gemmatimonadetes bacterium T265]|nr:hypothetical protein tb265_32560 [Gemmatimonadetes bacterium T265]
MPTDTPARDERLGWIGDAEAFAPTAAFNYEVAPFFTKWLGDLAADQKASGSVPDVIPDVLTRARPDGGGSSGWADAATIVPWQLYLSYGDARLLERQYPSMRRWVEYERGAAGPALIWTTGHHYGDWLDFASTQPGGDPGRAATPKDLVATAFFAHSADLVARAAAVLGNADDARAYRDLFERVRAAFQHTYVAGDGRLSPETQTAYALALEFDLLPGGLRQAAGDRLAAAVKQSGHLTTGFLGTPHLTDALVHTGHVPEAYGLLLRRDYPSWLYPITRGATTMWERWDGVKPDGTFEDVGMNSFNHYAYGAVGDWMYRTVAGLTLDPSAPGYKHVLVQPHPGGRLTSASATLTTPYGPVGSAWTLAGDTFRLAVRVPANTRATVRLPFATLARVAEGGRPVAAAAGVTRAVQDGEAVRVDVGSGDYRFTYPAPRLAAVVRTPPATPPADGGRHP